MNLVVRSIAQIVEIWVIGILMAVIKNLLCCLIPGVWLAQTSATKANCILGVWLRGRQRVGIASGVFQPPFGGT